MEIVEEDRISALPDCLILEILSHLPSTEEAVRTGTLSKRWEHLWTSVPTLIFQHDNDNHSQSDFVSLVDETLAEGRQLKLKKFELTYTRYNRYPVKWIRYALTCNVPEVNLLNPTEAISWKNLKSLYIHNAELDEGLIGHILIGSPVLETLVLDDCYGFELLNISKSVKKLVYSAYMNPQSFDVCAPFISSLTIKGDLYLSRPLLVDVSSLVEANIDYTHDETMPKEIEERRFKILLQTLQHVKEVKIGASFSKVVSRLEAKGFVFPANVKFVANG